MSGNSTFGKLNENLYQSDYISRKKSQLTYCNSSSYCNQITSATSYSQINSYNLGVYVNSLVSCNIVPVNKGNSVVAQFSKLNLNNVCTVNKGSPPLQPFTYASCNPAPVIINPTSNSPPFYITNTIDPLGELFGLTQCGELNYTNYMIFYPPTPPNTLAFS